MDCASIEILFCRRSLTNDFPATDLLLRYFGWRIIGSSMAWFFWDVAFYGNKLFQTTFLLALAGEDTSLLQLCGAAALNAFVALLGYIGAAFLLDHPQVGRLRLQQYGFLITGALFVACGFLYDKLAPGWLILMYVTSSFVGQLGPNATTFLIPSEIFPTEVRTQCHGIAAASGKLGALFAAVAFNYIGDIDMFLVSGYSSFAACVVTFWAIPDVTTLDLHEIDRLWSMTLDGRRSEYVGDANSPKYLSYYERTKLGTY
jgi:MFS family permease